MPEQLQKIIDNIAALGIKRVAALAASLVLILVTIGYGAYVVNKPAFETLYIGLDREDVNRMALTLGEAGIAYDIGSEGNSVSVEAGKTAQARMILAEKGLPGSSGAGYELFDNLGSLGLTSFMQEVTLVRALEGEIARSIQAISGIKAARVHIVMAEASSFRRAQSQPTASVIVRSSGMDLTQTAAAIRHLVAAAVPGLTTENVTVLDASGKLLAAGNDPLTNSLNNSVSIQQLLESQISDKIYKTLLPYLGPDNFRASVQASVNTDQKQIEETIFDPESRVERSVQVVKTEDSSSETTASDPATVEQNLPEAVQPGGTNPQSKENSQRREETTNYELNSKKIATVSNGYTIENLSVSVVVNAKRIAEILGSNGDAAAVNAKLEEIKQVVAAATGLNVERGDFVNVTSVDFIDIPDLDDATGAGLLDIAKRQLGTFINALAFIVVALLVIILGIRPMIATLRETTQDAATTGEAPGDQRAGGADEPATATSATAISSDDSASEISSESESFAEILTRPGRTPQERLAALIDLDEERSAQILRRWAQSEAA